MNTKDLGYQNTHKTLDTIGSIVSFFGWIVVIFGVVFILISLGVLGSGNGRGVSGIFGGLGILYGVGVILVGLLIVGNGQLLRTIGLIEKNTQLSFRINYMILQRVMGVEMESTSEDSEGGHINYDEWKGQLISLRPKFKDWNDEDIRSTYFYDRSFRNSISEEYRKGKKGDDPNP